MRNNRYPGKFIVFEGLDAAGKTTAAQKIVDSAGDKQNLVYLKGVGADNRWGKLARKYAKTALFLLELLIVTYSPLRDNLRKGKNVLMDKYFFFVASHIPDVNFPLNRMLVWITEPFMVRPDLVVYFDVSLEERIRRLQIGSDNRFHKILADNPQLIIERDELYKQTLLAGENTVHIVDTSKLDVREVVDILKSDIKNLIPKEEPGHEPAT